MADIFDEVSEELRQDQIKNIWKKYQKFIYLIFFIILLCVGSYKTYEYLEDEKLLNNSTTFFSALAKVEKNLNNEAELSFNKLNSDKDSGYYLLSKFALADLNFKKGNHKKMEKYYEEIINNDNFEKFYRDLALLFLTMNSTKMNNKDKIKRLNPILTSPSKLQSIAAELEILYLYESGEKQNADLKINQLMSRQDINNNQKNRLRVIQEIYKF